MCGRSAPTTTPGSRSRASSSTSSNRAPKLPQQLVQALIDEGLPVLRPHLPASVKVRESHQLARPMIHLDPRHKLTQALVELYQALA